MHPASRVSVHPECLQNARSLTGAHKSQRNDTATGEDKSERPYLHYFVPSPRTHYHPHFTDVDTKLRPKNTEITSPARKLHTQG